jgi:hypothetical protein
MQDVLGVLVYIVVEAAYFTCLHTTA